MVNYKKALIIVFAVVTLLFSAYEIYKIVAKDTPPVITISGEVLNVSVHDGENKYLEGVTAYDEQDGDLTAGISVSSVSSIIKGDQAQVTYIVFDSKGNVSTATRYIRYINYTRPSFEIAAPLLFREGQKVSIIDRVLVKDEIDGDISSKVAVSTLSLISNSEGIYHITLTATNSLGCTATLTVPVIVQDEYALNPVIDLHNYLIYVKEGDPAPDLYGNIESLTSPDGEKDVSKIEMIGEVDMQTAGTYYVQYKYTAGEATGIAFLTVSVS